GRREAKERGVPSPGKEDCVRYGLLRAARRNPLRAAPDEVPGLVRMALYEVPAGPDLDPATRELVGERALRAMWPHLAEPAAKFAPWFWGPKNPFAPQIAKKKTATGGALDLAVTRRGLLDEGWLAYKYVAGCVDAMLHLFRRLLPEPLNEAENRAYER